MVEATTSEEEDDAETVFRDHYPRLVAIAVHIVGGRAVAEELVQESFERYIAADRRADIENAGGWLTTAVTRRCLNELRRRKRESRALGRVASLTVVFDDLAFLSRPGLVAALAVLTPNQRALIVLVEGLDLSVSDAAAAIGCRPSTASVHLTRARRTLRVHRESEDEEQS